MRTLGGICLVPNENLKLADGHIEVRRSWRERLFSRPWRPLQAVELVTRYKPDPNFYAIDLDSDGVLGVEKCITAHPHTIAKLEERLDQMGVLKDMEDTLPDQARPEPPTCRWEDN